MRFIDHAIPCGGTSNSLTKAVNAGRATPVVAFRDDTLTKHFCFVPDAVAAIDHEAGAGSAFLNLNSPDLPDPHYFGRPVFYWPDLSEQPEQEPRNGQLPCGWPGPDHNF